MGSDRKVRVVISHQTITSGARPRHRKVFAFAIFWDNQHSGYRLESYTIGNMESSITKILLSYTIFHLKRIFQPLIRGKKLATSQNFLSKFDNESAELSTNGADRQVFSLIRSL